MTSTQRAEIGVIGGSGFYSFFDSPDGGSRSGSDGPERVHVDTPFGPPSDDLLIDEIDGRRVAFLARHGQGHRYPPHLVNYRANLWALRSVGVRQVLAPCAVGSLRAEHSPGTLLIPDQLVDRTSGRAGTVYDEVGPVVHVPFADPYCPQVRSAMLEAAAPRFERTVDGGTMVVIGGPRFSSRAESQWHQAAGWSVVGMTGMPEAAIARELAMCFGTACLITDNDAGVEAGETVTHSEVMRVFAANIEQLKVALREAISRLPATEPDDVATCPCRRVLDGQDLPITLP